MDPTEWKREREERSRAADVAEQAWNEEQDQLEDSAGEEGAEPSAAKAKGDGKKRKRKSEGATESSKAKKVSEDEKKAKKPKVEKTTKSRVSVVSFILFLGVNFSNLVGLTPSFFLFFFRLLPRTRLLTRRMKLSPRPRR